MTEAAGRRRSTANGVRRMGVLHRWRHCLTLLVMRSLTVRLPEDLVARIDAESRERGVSRSDIVRERLETASSWDAPVARLDQIADLIGSVDHLPSDVSARRKHYLKVTGYGRKRHR